MAILIYLYMHKYFVMIFNKLSQGLLKKLPALLKIISHSVNIDLLSILGDS